MPFWEIDGCQQQDNVSYLIRYSVCRHCSQSCAAMPCKKNLKKVNLCEIEARWHL